MRRLFARSVFATLVAGAVTLPAQANNGAGQCHAIDGPFTSVIVPPPACTSVVGLCTHGILHGDLEANYDFVADSLAPVDDPDHPGRLHYTGTSVISPFQGNSGQMFSDDEGFLDPDATGNAFFATTVHVIRGSKSDKKARGTLIAEGTLSFLTGEASGTYTGELCKEK